MTELPRSSWITTPLDEDEYAITVDYTLTVGATGLVVIARGLDDGTDVFGGAQWSIPGGPSFVSVANVPSRGSWIQAAPGTVVTVSVSAPYEPILLRWADHNPADLTALSGWTPWIPAGGATATVAGGDILLPGYVPTVPLRQYGQTQWVAQSEVSHPNETEHVTPSGSYAPFVASAAPYPTATPPVLVDDVQLPGVDFGAQSGIEGTWGYETRPSGEEFPGVSSESETARVVAVAIIESTPPPPSQVQGPAPAWPGTSIVLPTDVTPVASQWDEVAWLAGTPPPELGVDPRSTGGISTYGPLVMHDGGIIVEYAGTTPGARPWSLSLSALGLDVTIQNEEWASPSGLRATSQTNTAALRQGHHDSEEALIAWALDTNPLDWGEELWSQAVATTTTIDETPLLTLVEDFLTADPGYLALLWTTRITETAQEYLPIAAETVAWLNDESILGGAHLNASIAVRVFPLLTYSGDFRIGRWNLHLPPPPPDRIPLQWRQRDDGLAMSSTPSWRAGTAQSTGRWRGVI